MACHATLPNMTHDKNEMQIMDTLATLSCHVQTMLLDLDLLLSSNTPPLTDKFDADSAGFMRCSLGVYTLLESADAFQCLALSEDCQEAVQTAAGHVKALCDKLKASNPTMLSSRVEMLREHTHLLDRTLTVVQEDMLLRQGNSSRKRLCR